MSLYLDFVSIEPLEIIRRNEAESYESSLTTARVRRLFNELDQALAVAEDAYLLLLQIPPADRLRLKNQHVYCELRDFLAAAKNLEAEAVQNDAEEKALRITRPELFA